MKQPKPWKWPEKRWRGIVERVRAGRTLRPRRWPGGARCAIALSFDSDHETNELREAGESIGRLSQGQYGNRQGVPRILALLQRHGVKATFFVPAVTALLYPEEQKRVVAEGHEIGIHGWIHERNSVLPKKAERDLQMRSADVLEKITGVRPVGVRTPSWDFSPNTLAITKEMGLAYDSSLMADVDCYELLMNGKPTGVVELPVEWIRDDAVYFNMNRFAALRPYTPPEGVFDIFRREETGRSDARRRSCLGAPARVRGRRGGPRSRWRRRRRRGRDLVRDRRGRALDERARRGRGDGAVARGGAESLRGRLRHALAASPRSRRLPDRRPRQGH